MGTSQEIPDIFIFMRFPHMHEITMQFTQTAYFRIAERCIASMAAPHQNRRLPHHVLLHVLHGEISVCEDGQPYTVRPGEWLLLKGGVHHYGLNPIPVGTEWLYAHFFLSDMRQKHVDAGPFYGHVKNQEFDLADYNQSILLPKHFAPHDARELRQQLEEIVETYKTGDDMRAMRCSLSLTSLLLSLYSAQQSNKPAQRQDALVGKIIRYLEENRCRCVDSAEIAAHLQMNYRYLCGVFKQKTGMTIQAYHARLRINEGAHMLRSGVTRVSEVAQALGFQDPLYFSYVFKRVMHASPTQYARLFYQASAAPEK